jgi:hypothetical protein
MTMSRMKDFLEQVALREFGEVTEETLSKAAPVAQKELMDKGATSDSVVAVVTVLVDQLRETAATQAEATRLLHRAIGPAQGPEEGVCQE